MPYMSTSDIADDMLSYNMTTLTVKPIAKFICVHITIDFA